MFWKRQRRGDQVPVVLAQSTPCTERLCSLLSAKVLRQPAQPLVNRLPWQLVADRQKQEYSRRNIQLVVLVEAKTGGENTHTWLDRNFVHHLQDYTSPSLCWFCTELDRDPLRFPQRWTQWMSTICAETTDVYVIVGSQAALNQVSESLIGNETGNVVRGILSVLPYSSESNHSTTTGTPLPLPHHIPDGIFHWMIHTHAPVSATSRPGALVVAGHGQTISQTLPARPPTLWLVRAAVWFASAVQAILQTDSYDDDDARLRSKL
eukprot:scaffold227_cov165-Amphora_coffeaeformis.AAC.39